MHILHLFYRLVGELFPLETCFYNNETSENQTNLNILNQIGND